MLAFIYFAIELSLKEISFVVYVHALIRWALMTRKLSAIGMCNAILRNRLDRFMRALAGVVKEMKFHFRLLREAVRRN